jgi:hypothetical protein
LLWLLHLVLLILWQIFVGSGVGIFFGSGEEIPMKLWPFLLYTEGKRKQNWQSWEKKKPSECGQAGVGRS